MPWCRLLGYVHSVGPADLAGLLDLSRPAIGPKIWALLMGLSMTEKRLNMDFNLDLKMGLEPK